MKLTNSRLLADKPLAIIALIALMTALVGVLPGCSLIDSEISNPIVEVRAVVNDTEWQGFNITYQNPRSSSATVSFSAFDRSSRQVIEVELSNVDTIGTYPIGLDSGQAAAAFTQDGIIYRAAEGTLTVRSFFPNMDCLFEFDAVDNSGSLTFRVRQGSYKTNL